jgi:hypothetical protein
MAVRVLATALVAALLCACAQQPLYQWGGYEDLLYRSYKSPEETVKLRTEMESHVLKLQQAGQKVPPGLYSEIATLHMQAGDRASATRYYTLEKQAWPESRGLMEALINNLDKKKEGQPL